LPEPSKLEKTQRNPNIALLVLMRYKSVGFEAGGRRQEAGGRRQEAKVSVLDSFENSYILYFINLKYAITLATTGKKLVVFDT